MNLKKIAIATLITLPLMSLTATAGESDLQASQAPAQVNSSTLFEIIYIPSEDCDDFPMCEWL
ncbi:MAG: hypothetical protein ACI8WB_005950 [Phenylobacterium sp.]|jgi:hypothetical protein